MIRAFQFVDHRDAEILNRDPAWPVGVTINFRLADED